MSPNHPLQIDALRRVASDQLDPSQRASLGQFMTPSAIATFMASLFQRWPDEARLLDPGAGIGSLSEAFARHYLDRGKEESLSAAALQIAHEKGLGWSAIAGPDY